MKTALIFLLFFTFSCVSGAAQTTKRSTRKTMPKAQTANSLVPCLSNTPPFEVFLDELKHEWRLASATTDKSFYYNTKKEVCENRILKIWVKSEMISPAMKYASNVKYSMMRYEINCHKDQLRVTSQTDYGASGQVIGGFTSDLEKQKWMMLFQARWVKES